MDELRDVLAVLRDGEPAATRPQPGLADLPRLVAEAEAAGQRVDYSAGDEVARQAPRSPRACTCRSERSKRTSPARSPSSG
ncbi:hypothetical protein [Nonomuraea fuscirosea]|uniref:hypothetical protein n=1 Tax=Nonomuraea fuscirosea TaxID=1291556 RepID=UPI002DDA75A9|nr:hypothetical protein [Nonomuraea fuscirosea]